MLFKDILQEKTDLIRTEFDKLVDLALEKQTHDGDLLLIHVNGHYNPDANEWNILPKLSSYMIGPTMAGHSEATHYDFIHKYRTQLISSLTYPEYLKLHEYSPERREEIDRLSDDEGMTIQLEMLIYLKIWEGDSFIKKLYQLVRLAKGEPYDWHFKIQESNRDKDITGKRDVIIRNLVRDRIKSDLPTLYEVLVETYKTQIRNSIAHSNYSFTGRSIGLNNYVKEDPSCQLHAVKFDEWVSIFHNTMVIYNEVNRIMNLTQSMYEEGAIKYNNGLFTIRINRTDPEVKTEYHHLKVRKDFHDWNWAQNEK